MDKRYFLELTDYMIWTNRIIIGWLKQITEEQWDQVNASSFSSVRDTVVHMVSAEKVWIDFWKRKDQPVFLSAQFNGTKEELIEIWEKTSRDLKIYIEQLTEESERQVLFRWRGEEWQLEFWQTFSHFINHATYHRGQLVTLLRQVGFSYFSSTDLATYYRLNR